MNLNKYKKTINTIQPERGLHNLVGAEKFERTNRDSGAIRVTGKYISGHAELNFAGRILGMIAYISSWVAGLFMLGSLILPSLNLPHPFTSFITGLIVVNGSAMLADSFQRIKCSLGYEGVSHFLEHGWTNFCNELF